MIDESLDSDSDFEIGPDDLVEFEDSIGPFAAALFGDGRVTLEMESPQGDASIVLFLSPEAAARLCKFLAGPPEHRIFCSCTS